MIALGLLVASLTCLAGGVAALRRTGPGWRVGRLLHVAPHRSLTEAAGIARAGAARYIRVHGRVDSEEEFPGDDDKPIVFRRHRLQRRGPRGRWQTFGETRQAVPFRLAERGEGIAIDVDALGDGLVVVPRYSEGVAADVPADLVTGPLPEMAPETPVRLRIDHLSSVEHATAAGVPIVSEEGEVTLTAGLGRPLIVTPLELDEAMRVLGADGRPSMLMAGALIVAAPVLLVAAAGAAVAGW